MLIIKNTIKIVLISLVVASLFGFLLLDKIVFAAYSAQSGADQLCTDASTCPIQSPSDIFTKILKPVVQWTYTIFFAVAVIFILIAAFSFLTAKGNPEKINSARSQIMWACVAIAIALISVGAAQIINTLIGGS